MGKNRVYKTDRDRGANLIEMALVMVLLLIMLAGVVDVGRAFYTYIAITNAAREGARYGSRFPFDTTGIEAAVNREGQNNGINVTGIAISCATSGGAAVGCDAVPSGGSIQVTATVGDFVTILSAAVGADSFVLRNGAIMIVFGSND